MDLRPDGNHGYYRRPDGRWAPIPWDNDMMFVPRHHQPGHVDAVGCLRHPRIGLEYRNRGREVLDLFAADATDRGGQVGQLAADLGAALTPAGYAVDWPRLDEAVWNRHPRMNQKGSYYVNPAAAEHFGEEPGGGDGHLVRFGGRQCIVGRFIVILGHRNGPLRQRLRVCGHRLASMIRPGSGGPVRRGAVTDANWFL